MSEQYATQTHVPNGAGWYPTPVGQRYWDGSQWLDVKTGTASAAQIVGVINIVLFAVWFMGAVASAGATGWVLLMVVVTVPLSVTGFILSLIAFGHGPLVRSKAWTGLVTSVLPVAAMIGLTLLGWLLMASGY